MENGLEQIRAESECFLPGGPELAEAACRCLLQVCFPQALPRLNQHFGEPDWIRDLRQENNGDPARLLRLAGVLVAAALETPRE